MAESQLGKNQSHPIKVIDISSSSDDDIRVISPIKPQLQSNSTRKKPSFKSKPTPLDVSLWNSSTSNNGTVSTSANRPTAPRPSQNGHTQSTSSKSTLRPSLSSSLPPSVKKQSLTQGNSNQSTTRPSTPSQSQSSTINHRSIQAISSKSTSTSSKPQPSIFKHHDQANSSKSTTSTPSQPQTSISKHHSLQGNSSDSTSRPSNLSQHDNSEILLFGSGPPRSRQHSIAQGNLSKSTVLPSTPNQPSSSKQHGIVQGNSSQSTVRPSTSSQSQPPIPKQHSVVQGNSSQSKVRPSTPSQPQPPGSKQHNIVPGNLSKSTVLSSTPSQPQPVASKQHNIAQGNLSKSTVPPSTSSQSQPPIPKQHSLVQVSKSTVPPSTPSQPQPPISKQQSFVQGNLSKSTVPPSTTSQPQPPGSKQQSLAPSNLSKSTVPPSTSSHSQPPIPKQDSVVQGNSSPSKVRPSTPSQPQPPGSKQRNIVPVNLNKSTVPPSTSSQPQPLGLKHQSVLQGNLSKSTVPPSTPSQSQPPGSKQQSLVPGNSSQSTVLPSPANLQPTTSKSHDNSSNQSALNSKRPRDTVDAQNGTSNQRSIIQKSMGSRQMMYAHVQSHPASTAPNPTISAQKLPSSVPSNTNPTGKPTGAQEATSSGPSNMQKSTTMLVSLSLDSNSPVINPTPGVSNKDDVQVHKKRKCETTIELNSINHENRFTELPDTDCHRQSTAMPNCLPSQQPPTLAASSKAQTPIQRPGASAAPCAMHPYATLPLPKLKPKARPPPKSVDWSGVPRHRRPLQGQERPEEFSTDIQQTWILHNKPDLSTPLGHLIFTQEINSNQMWENPEIPRIDVIVPDEVKENSRSGRGSSGYCALAPPLEFVYTDRVVYRTDERPIPPNWHCNCHGDCLHNPDCECRAHQTSMVRQIMTTMGDEYAKSLNLTNFEGFAYASTRRPRHSHAKKAENEDPEARRIKPSFMGGMLPVFECNSRCGCGPDCINRTVGRGRREKLSLEKTVSRGWGVFAQHTIPMGRLVTHYSGELITEKMAVDRGMKKYDKIGRTYIFALDPWWLHTICPQNFVQDGLLIIGDDTAKSTRVEQTSTIISGNTNLSSTSNPSLVSKRKHTETESIPKKAQEDEVECLYSVDAFLYGNISRFINHSCSANTYIIPVYIEDSDPTRPIFAMFASKMIKAGKEITTSYSDPNPEDEQDEELRKKLKDGTHLGRYMQCKCGAPNCRGLMFA